MKLLSVIVPCYNEEENVVDFYNEFIKNEPFLNKREMDFEIIYINDGSKDNTIAVIKKLHERDETRCPFPEILGKKQVSTQA